jgi:hypothetical protein
LQVTLGDWPDQGEVEMREEPETEEAAPPDEPPAQQPPAKEPMPELEEAP